MAENNKHIVFSVLIGNIIVIHILAYCMVKILLFQSKWLACMYTLICQYF